MHTACVDPEYDKLRGGPQRAQRPSRVPDLAVVDLDASRSFYRDTLGLEILREDEGDRIVFRCGGGTQSRSR